MLVAVASVKGSPGATASALTLAAAWPRPVVLLEADPSGGDLAYRCTAAGGGPPSADRGLLGLAAAVRSGEPGQGLLVRQAQPLACGVSLIQGVTSAAQGRGLASLWQSIAEACLTAGVDVLVDVGRLERTSPVMPLVQAASLLLPVTTRALDSVMHLANGLPDLMATFHNAAEVGPLLVGPRSAATADCVQLDGVLHHAGLPTLPTRAMPYDPRALERLQSGEKPEGRLKKTTLLRAALAIAASSASGRPQAPNKVSAR
jgi:hypothetical protein